MKNKITWNSLGLSQNRTGIENVAISFSWRLFELYPNVDQEMFISTGSLWTSELPPNCVVNILKRKKFDLVRSVDLGRRNHSWAKNLSRADRSRSSTYTVHDWGPFVDRTMSNRNRAMWASTILHSISCSSAVHFLNEALLASTPSVVKKLIEQKVVLVSTPKMRVSQNIRNINMDHRFILAIGSNLPRKNFSKLSYIWKQARILEELGYKLVIIGKGTEGFTSNEVLGLGYVNDDDLASYIASCSALICIAEYEGQNLPIAEALFAGKPVISTKESSTAYSDFEVHKLNETNAKSIKDAVSKLTSRQNFSFNGIVPEENRLIEYLVHS